MLNRKELKIHARKNLSGSYGIALLVSVVALFLTGNGSWFNFQFNNHDLRRFGGMDITMQGLMQNVWVQLILAALAMATLVGFLFRIFISTVIEAGESRWFSRNRESRPTPGFGQMFSLFQSRNWLPTVGAMVWRNIWLWLWSLLSLLPVLAGLAAAGAYLYLNPSIQWPAGWDFSRPFRGSWAWEERRQLMQEIYQALVGFFSANPGVALALSIGTIVVVILAVLLTLPYINRLYAYRLTSWILADNPRIGALRALRLSRQMTKGRKFDLFVLDLSFIGWYLLGALVFLVGILFVRPYYTATMAEAYAVLRKNAVEQGLVTMQDFGFRAVSSTSEATMDTLPPVETALETVVEAEAETPVEIENPDPATHEESEK
jgi:uncharacterized membrane protein